MFGFGALRPTPNPLTKEQMERLEKEHIARQKKREALRIKIEQQARMQGMANEMLRAGHPPSYVQSQLIDLIALDNTITELTAPATEP